MHPDAALDDRLGYQKVDLLRRKVELTPRELSNILELDERVVDQTLGDGVPPEGPGRAGVDDQFFSLLVLFDYLLNLCDQDFGKLSRMWNDSDRSRSPYTSAIVKPPWYETGVRGFLLECRAAGLEACITWIRKH